MADSDPDIQPDSTMSIIPYDVNREVVLRHQDLIVYVDPESRQLVPLGRNTQHLDTRSPPRSTGCPVCGRPFHEENSTGPVDPSGPSHRGNEESPTFIDHEYFRMLAVRNLRDSPSTSSHQNTSNDRYDNNGYYNAANNNYEGRYYNTNGGNLRTNADYDYDYNGNNGTSPPTSPRRRIAQPSTSASTSTSASASGSGARFSVPPITPPPNISAPGADPTPSDTIPPPGAEFVGSSPAPAQAYGISDTAFTPNYFEKFFTIERELGRGGRGVVLLVKHVLDGVQLGHFACKRVRVGDDHAWLEKVLVEVQALQTLSHQNLVSYRHVWLQDYQENSFGPSIPYAFILQQYCNGGDMHSYVCASAQVTVTTQDLKDRIRRKSRGDTDMPAAKPVTNEARRLHFDEIHTFFRDITEGLRFLHLNGFIHRDLKPSNCLLHRVGGETRVLVSDFGEVQYENVMRKSTGATGTISYCAPEVLTRVVPGGPLGNFTFKSDVFSLGMILHFLCFADLPYQYADVLREEEEDLDALRVEIAEWSGFEFEFDDQRLNRRNASRNTHRSQSRHMARTDLPAKLYVFLNRLLSVDPDDRPTADEVLKGMAVGGLEAVMPETRRRNSASPEELTPGRRIQHLDSTPTPSNLTLNATSSSRDFSRMSPTRRSQSRSHPQSQSRHHSHSHGHDQVQVSTPREREREPQGQVRRRVPRRLSLAPPPAAEGGSSPVQGCDPAENAVAEDNDDDDDDDDDDNDDNDDDDDDDDDDNDDDDDQDRRYKYNEEEEERQRRSLSPRSELNNQLLLPPPTHPASQDRRPSFLAHIRALLHREVDSTVLRVAVLGLKIVSVIHPCTPSSSSLFTRTNAGYGCVSESEGTGGNGNSNGGGSGVPGGGSNASVLYPLITLALMELAVMPWQVWKMGLGLMVHVAILWYVLSSGTLCQ